MQSKLSEATESCTNLKNLLEATQQVSEWICRLISLHKIRPLATSYSFSVVHCHTASHSTTHIPLAGQGGKMLLRYSMIFAVASPFLILIDYKVSRNHLSVQTFSPIRPLLKTLTLL